MEKKKENRKIKEKTVTEKCGKNERNPQKKEKTKKIHRFSFHIVLIVGKFSALS